MLHARSAKASLAIRALVALVTAASCGTPSTAQNSTRKIRKEPSELAARCGTAVDWHESVDAALEAARESGRPVFWYVPTVPRSRMDRKPEIDRYMRAGPFSWPGTIQLLDGHFEAVAAVPGRERAAQFDLRPVAFVEPGFVVLSPDGELQARHDELTTFHPGWFNARLIAALPEEQRQVAARAASSPWQMPGDADDGTAPSVAWLDGVARFDAGDSAGAREAWQRLVASAPEHPLAWKAQAELEGHGPYVCGFEVHGDLAERVVEVTSTAVRGTRAPRGHYAEPALLAAAAAYFDRMQRANGSFVDSRYDFGGTDSLPNVHVAITSLVALALLEMQAAAGGEVEWADRGEATLLAARDYAVADEHLNPQDRDELIWAHLYRCRMLARWLDLRPQDTATIKPLLTRAAEAIVAMQTEGGAWYHEYPNPFVSGSCLVALADARRHGIETPEPVIERGVRALLACRLESGAVTYGQVRPGRQARARVEGGVGRMPLAEHALQAWGQGDSATMLRALEASFEHHGELDAVRKYDDHASRYGYGGFFFWYDLHVRVEAIAALPSSAERSAWLAQQREQILALPEIDGCFVDSHELGRVYGTAMAMICLARCAD